MLNDHEHIPAAPKCTYEWNSGYWVDAETGNGFGNGWESSFWSGDGGEDVSTVEVLFNPCPDDFRALIIYTTVFAGREHTTKE